MDIDAFRDWNKAGGGVRYLGTLMLFIKYQQDPVFLPERAEMCLHGRSEKIFIGFCAGGNEINLISLKNRDQSQGAFEALVSLQNTHLLLCDLSVV